MEFYFFVCYLVVLAVAHDISVPEQIIEDGPTGRIAGGTLVEDINEFDYLVQVQDAEFCSGVVIDPRYILSGAGCFNENSEGTDITVRAGSVIRGQGQLVPVSGVVFHPNYDPDTNEYDVAIIRTVEPMNITPADVNVESLSYIGKFIVAGWGITDMSNNMLAGQLRKVQFKIVNDELCEDIYSEETPEFSSREINIQVMFCLRNDSNHDEGCCVGDRGSPAIKRGTSKLYGLFSFSQGCGRGMRPSVFTDLQNNKVLDFISRATGKKYTRH